MENIITYDRDMWKTQRQKEAFQFLANAIERCRQEGIGGRAIFDFVVDFIKVKVEES